MRQLDPDIDEDILDMSAGLLARRLTSNSASNPKIRLLLRQLDETATVKDVQHSVLKNCRTSITY